MRTQTMIFGMLAVTVLGTALVLTAPAYAADVDTTTPAPAAPAPPPAATRAVLQPAPMDASGAVVPPSATLGYPSGVNEVLKLFKGGISADIMVSYIKNSTLTFHLSADNIIALKQQGVQPEVLTAMILRSGEMQRQGGMTSAAPAQMSVQVPSQAPAPTYYSYSSPAADAAASASFNAALQTRAANAYIYAPPVYTAPAPVYYDYDPYAYSWGWDPFFAPVGIDFGIGYYGGRFGHVGGFGRVGGLGRVGGRSVGAGRSVGGGRR
jgi:hypothetical protein